MKRNIGLFAALGILLVGCSPRTASITPEFRSRTLAQLQQGTINLDCTAACAWTWVNERQGLQALDAASQWDQLAVKVAQIGYQKDLGYYYLGNAAEGLGYPDAARRYYRESLTLATDSNPGPQCRATDGGCMGVDLLAVLPAKLNAPTASAQARPSRKVRQTSVANNQPWVRIRCNDGRRFAMRFRRGDPDKAEVMVDDNPKVEIYENTHGASGIHYLGPTGYWISEWHDQWSYMDNHNPPRETDCKQIS